ncbi:hypothetical protein Tco_0756994 [Tanacetum coccineum]
MAHMALSDSKVNNDKSCSKTWLTNYEALKKQYDDLLVKLDDTGFKAATYKREEIALLKRSVCHKEYQMGLLRDELEKVKQEKEGFEFKIAKFDKSAKDLSEMLESQITDKSKKGVGYHVVPSPHPLILNRPTPLDLSYSGLEEFKEPEVNEYGPRDSSLKPTIGCDKESDNSKENTDDSLEQHQITDTETSSVKSSLKVDKDWKEKFFYPANHVREVEPKKVRENNDAPIIEDWVSDDEDDDEPNPKVEKKTVIPTAAKIEKPVRKQVKYAEMYKSFDHLKKDCGKRIIKPIWKNTRRVNDHYSTRMTHSNPRRNMFPQAVLMRSEIKAVNTAKPKDTHNAVKRNIFNTVKASANGCTGSGEARVQQRKRRIQRRVPQKQKDQEDEVFGRILLAKKMKPRDELVLLSQQLVLLEENNSYCSRLQLPVLNQSVNTVTITAVGEKVNVAESLLVVSTEVNAN